MTVVIGEVNIISILSFLLALVGQTVWVISYLNRLSDRSIRADELARKADERSMRNEQRIGELVGIKEDVSEAHNCAKQCKEKIDIFSAAFGLFKEMVAREYITKGDLTNFESRQDRRLERLGDKH